jgi:hypothetical protein
VRPPGRFHSESVNSLAIAQAHAGLAAAPNRDSAILSTQTDLQALEAGSSLDEKQSVENEQAKTEWEYEPVNPRNWPNRKKWIMVYIVSVSIFMSRFRTLMARCRSHFTPSYRLFPAR